MIIVDLPFFLSLALCLLLVSGFSLWYFEKPGRGRKLFLDPKHIWFCTVCTYTYINTKNDNISACPRCGGYNKKA